MKSNHRLSFDSFFVATLLALFVIAVVFFVDKYCRVAFILMLAPIVHCDQCVWKEEYRYNLDMLMLIYSSAIILSYKH